MKVFRKKEISIWSYLKISKISKLKFIWFYLSLMQKSIFRYAYKFFRYMMLIIWRRTLIIWTSLLAYLNLTVESIGNALEYSIEISKMLNIYWIIPSIILFPIMLKILIKLYKYLFNYRDILNFNDELKKYYVDNITNWIEKEVKIVENKKNNKKKEVKKENKSKKYVTEDHRIF